MYGLADAIKDRNAQFTLVMEARDHLMHVKTIDPSLLTNQALEWLDKTAIPPLED